VSGGGCKVKSYLSPGGKLVVQDLWGCGKVWEGWCGDRRGRLCYCRPCSLAGVLVLSSIHCLRVG